MCEQQLDPHQHRNLQPSPQEAAKFSFCKPDSLQRRKQLPPCAILAIFCLFDHLSSLNNLNLVQSPQYLCVSSGYSLDSLLFVFFFVDDINQRSQNNCDHSNMSKYSKDNLMCLIGGNETDNNVPANVFYSRSVHALHATNYIFQVQ